MLPIETKISPIGNKLIYDTYYLEKYVIFLIFETPLKAIFCDDGWLDIYGPYVDFRWLFLKSQNTSFVSEINGAEKCKFCGSYGGVLPNVHKPCE